MPYHLLTLITFFIRPEIWTQSSKMFRVYAHQIQCHIKRSKDKYYDFIMNFYKCSPVNIFKS